MKSKFISLILAIAVIVAMVAVPAVVSTVAASGGVTVSITPTPKYVLPGANFTIDTVINNPGGLDLFGAEIHLNFNPSYFTVNSVSAVDLTYSVQPPAINNTAGTIDWGPTMPLGTTTNATTIISSRINCTAKLLEGVTPVSWVYTNGPPPRLSKVVNATAFDYLESGNMSLMLNGSVIIGSPKLTVDVSPGLKGDVKIAGVIPGSYPNTTTWGWGANVTLQAMNTVGGWAFSSWSGDLTGSTNPKNITMDSLTKNVTANFVELPPAIGLSTSTLSFVTYEGVNPADQTFDITNNGGQTLSWAIEPRPTWDAGDWWLFYNSWWDGVNGTAAPNNITMSVTGESGCNYVCFADFQPPASRTIEDGMPAIMHNATVLVDERSLDYVQQVANIDLWLGAWTPVVATVSWVYFGDHGWPYYPGKSWSYNVTEVVTVGPVELVNKTTTAYAMVTNFTPITTAAGTFGCWEITHFLNPGDISGTTFMQTYWSDQAQAFVQQWDAGTYDYPPLDIRSLLAYSSTPPAGMPSWLSANPMHGNLVGHGASQTVTVSVNATGLTVGSYSGVITVTDPCASSATVAVDLEVKPATYIPSMRDLPGNALLPNQTYAGDTFDVYVNFTSSADGLNSIGLTDVAPAGWTVQVDKTWCSPEAYAVQTWGNKVEVLWSGPYGVGQNFSAMYKVTVPVTAKPGINTWEVCPNMTKSWLEYYFGEDGPHKACISGEYQMMITVPGKVTGETRDVNAALLSDVDVALLKAGVGAVDTDASTPNYSNDAHTTGMYWEVSTKALYYDINMTGMIMLPANWIDLSTPEVLAAGKVFDFEGNYGLVPRACTMSYAMKSVNLWLFPPTGHPEWGIAEWKAMDSIHSWQFPS